MAYEKHKKPLQQDNPWHRAKSVCEKIKKQFLPYGKNSPAGYHLCYAVIDQTIRDLFEKDWRSSATLYLNGDMWHAQKCDVDPDWIRYLLKRSGVCFSRSCPVTGWAHKRHDCEKSWSSEQEIIPVHKGEASDRLRAMALKTVEKSEYDWYGIHASQLPTADEFYEQKRAIMARLRQ